MELFWSALGNKHINHIMIMELNLSFKDVLKQILKLKPEVGRGSLHKTKINGKEITIIDDSYNANPTL